MPHSQQEEFPLSGIAIAGGGLVGMACALALHHSLEDACAITLIDPVFGSTPRPDPRASAITAGSRHMLETLGVWAEVAPHAQPVNAMNITDARLEQVLRPVYLTFDEARDADSPLAHIVPNDILYAALRKQLEATKITLCGKSIERMEQATGHAVLHLSDGSTRKVMLAIAADGARSALRRQAGVPDYGWAYRHTAIVTTIAHTAPHNGQATQHFLEGGPFALLPLTGNRSSVVWNEPHDKAHAIMALPDDAFCAALAERAGTFLGDITVVNSRASHPLALRMARRFIAPRLAIIGDAAHGVHPVAGQGVNLGFKDVAALAETITDAVALGSDYGTEQVLRRYEQWRHADTVTMLGVTDALVRLFGAQASPVRMLRDIGLGLVDRLPWVKRTLIQAASGSTDSAPRLLQGKR